MINWYKGNDKKVLNHELFYSDSNIQSANKQAIKWVKIDQRDITKKSGSITSSQLRRYYNDIKNIEKQWNHDEKNWDRIYPLVVMVKAKLAYDSRKNEKLPEEFQNFMNECIDSIKTSSDFGAFLKYFEAVVGFYYGEVKDLK